MPLLARLPIQIRFCDVDSLRHVNNAFYLSYFELARMKLFELSGLEIDWNKTGIILARIEIDYKKPVLLHDSVEIVCHPGNIGNKSFELFYEMTRLNGTSHDEVVCQGKTVQVCYDYILKQSITIPEEWKKALIH